MSDIQSLTFANTVDYGQVLVSTDGLSAAAGFGLYRGIPVERYSCHYPGNLRPCVRCRTHPPCINGAVAPTDPQGLWVRIANGVSGTTSFPGSLAVIDDPGSLDDLDRAVEALVDGRLAADDPRVLHVYRVAATPGGGSALVGKVIVLAVQPDPP